MQYEHGGEQARGRAKTQPHLRADDHSHRANAASRASDPWRAVLGAVARDGRTAFRVHAPAARELAVVLEGKGRDVPMSREDDGYWAAEIDGVGPGALYRYRIDGQAFPDPCSRFQPQGVHGPSQVVDPGAYAWRDAQWKGVTMPGQVMYELHVGAFTPQGTFDAAIARLPLLREVGVTVIEVMPIAEFPGRWNWGYDGAALFAPYHGYGDYDAFKRFVDAAHAIGMAVILDVVYNHLGPDGCYLPAFNPHVFSDRPPSEWGQALDFDSPKGHALRDLVIRNAAYWVGEFHLDGLRLDATQAILDDSPRHVVAELTAAARAAAAPRRIIVVGENEPQDTRALARVEDGGWGLDALWNDDFHHSARVALTRRPHAYMEGYRGAPQEFISAVKRGFLYQGQYYAWQKQRRGGVVTDEPAAAFVTFLENHDQSANALYGPRVVALASAARVRTLTALLLLAPQTPLLFMGQEFGSTRPFVFFADHVPDLAEKVHAGRREFLAQFKSYATPESQARVDDPADERTFAQCKLDWDERERHAALLALHTDLLALRRDDETLAAQDRRAIDGAVIGPDAFVLRWFDAAHGDRLLLVNLGLDVVLDSVAEPLLAPPTGEEWTLTWSSEAPRYGGTGALGPTAGKGWCIGGESAVLCRATPRRDAA